MVGANDRGSVGTGEFRYDMTAKERMQLQANNSVNMSLNTVTGHVNDNPFSFEVTELLFVRASSVTNLGM